MARKLLCPAALLLALTLIFTGCSVKKVNNIPSSEQVSAFGDFKHYFGELNENEKRAYNAILRDIEFSATLSRFPRKLKFRSSTTKSSKRSGSPLCTTTRS